MKLSYIANVRLPTEKAHGLQIMKMCESFVGVGAEVELVVPNRRNLIKDDPFGYYGVKKKFNISRHMTLDLTGLIPRLGFLAQAGSFSVSAGLRVGKDKRTIVYGRDPIVLSLVYLFSKKTFFWEAHTASWSLFARFVSRRAKGIVVISKGLYDFYKNQGVPEKKMLVACDGVDLAQFHYLSKNESLSRASFGVQESKKVVAYVGRLKTMGKNKGVQGIIQAFATLLQNEAQAFLLLVGVQQTERQEVEKVLDDYGIRKDNFLILSTIKPPELPKYLSLADVLVMNYPHQRHYAHFMSPLKMFEYMAANRAIVSSDLPALREVLNETNSVLVTPDDPEALALGLLKVIKSPDFAKKIAHKARVDVEFYTWDKRAAKIVEFIRASL